MANVTAEWKCYVTLHLSSSSSFWNENLREFYLSRMQVMILLLMLDIWLISLDMPIELDKILFHMKCIDEFIDLLLLIRVEE